MLKLLLGEEFSLEEAVMHVALDKIKERSKTSRGV